jgi:hypothetical protein
MSETKLYSAGMVSKPFCYIEFKKVAELLAAGKSYADIKQSALQGHLFDAKKEYRAKEIYRIVTARIKTLDDEAIKLFAQSDMQTKKLIALVAAMNVERLLYEFLHEVYQEKLALRASELSETDLKVFFKNKQEQDETVAKWTDGTIQKLRNSILNYLTDAGLLLKADGRRQITPPIPGTELKAYLRRAGLGRYLAAMTGERA